MHAFVGADRNGARQGGQRGVLAGGKRLLDQHHARRGAGRHVGGPGLYAPGLVGIDDQLALRCGGPHGGDALRVTLARQLYLEQWPLCRCGCRLCHGCGRAN